MNLHFLAVVVMNVLRPSQFTLEQFGAKARLWLGFKSTHMLPPALLKPTGEIPLLLSHHAEAKGQEAAAEHRLNVHLFFFWFLLKRISAFGQCNKNSGPGSGYMLGNGGDVPLAPWCNMAEILNM